MLLILNNMAQTFIPLYTIITQAQEQQNIFLKVKESSLTR